MSARRSLPLLLLAAVLVTVGLSSASSIGTVASNRLDGFTGAGPSGSPTVYASDHFTGTTGTNINGRALVIGGTWTVAAGTWVLNTNQAEINGVPLGRAVTSTGRADARLVATVADSGQGGRTSGVVFRSDATGSTFLSAYSQNGSGGRIYLAKRSGSTSTTLVTFTGVTFTNPASFVVEVSGANVKVSYNGTLYINHTLSPADQTTFGGLGGYGLLNDNAALVRFDDFRVESL
jgi:hypothetical protein